MARREEGQPTAFTIGNAQRVQGEDAQRQNIQAGEALAETVASTLGPNGRDKMLIGSDGTVVVTNDGASILDRTEVEHPAAKAIREVAESQNVRVGDGTTTAVLLAGALLGEAESLLDKGLHPASILGGYRRGMDRADRTLDVLSREIDPDDERALEALARTAITGRWNDEATAFMSSLAVEAVRAATTAGNVDRGAIRLKPVIGGSLRDSAVLDGLVIDTSQSSTTVSTREIDAPRRIDDAGIAIVDGQLTVDTADTVGSVTVTSPDELRELREHERSVYREQIRRIVDAGADVVFCQKSIDDAAQYLLAREGVLAVERTRRDELHALERATGGTIVKDAGELTGERVGFAGLVERRRVADTELTVITDCVDADPVSVLLRGGTDHVLDETKRIVEDCLDVTQLGIQTSAVLPGGGAVEVALARDLRAFASGISGREQLAVERYADALETVPKILARSSGADPIDVLVELRRRQRDDDGIGFDATTGSIVNTVDRGILEPLEVKRRAVLGASEAACVIVRIDDVVAAQRQDETDEHAHAHDHGPRGLQHDPEGYPWTIGH